MEPDVTKLVMQDEFRVCPECGCRDGFHSIFRKEDETTRWLLVCPACHKIFDIGMSV